MDTDRECTATGSTGRSLRPALSLLLGVAASLAACAPTAQIVGGGAGPVLREPVKLATGSVSADLNVVGDASQILRESAGDSLGAAEMACPDTSTRCPTVDLHVRIARPASAFSAASPPIRIVELIAQYHGTGQTRDSTALAYQRTIAAPGDLSTATWMRISDALMNDLAGDFSFRSLNSGIVIRLPSWAAWPASLQRATAPMAFHVATTGDGRDNSDTIGSVAGREVRLSRRATDYITEMLTDDLRGAGHTIVPARDGRLVGSELEKFWISSAQVSGDWQTTAEIDLALEVAPPPGVKRKKAEHHRCTASERTSHSPGEPDLARVLHECLAGLAASIRNDSAWSPGPTDAAKP